VSLRTPARTVKRRKSKRSDGQRMPKKMVQDCPFYQKRDFCRCVYLGFLLVTGCDRDDDNGFHALGRVDQGSGRDIGGTKDTNSKSILEQAKDGCNE